MRLWVAVHAVKLHPLTVAPSDLAPYLAQTFLRGPLVIRGRHCSRSWCGSRPAQHSLRRTPAVLSAHTQGYCPMPPLLVAPPTTPLTSPISHLGYIVSTRVDLCSGHRRGDPCSARGRHLLCHVIAVKRTVPSSECEGPATNLPGSGRWMPLDRVYPLSNPPKPHSPGPSYHGNVPSRTHIPVLCPSSGERSNGRTSDGCPSAVRPICVREENGAMDRCRPPVLWRPRCSWAA